MPNGLLEVYSTAEVVRPQNLSKLQLFRERVFAQRRASTRRSMGINSLPSRKIAAFLPLEHTSLQFWLSVLASQ
ncbi:hypothetical protein CEXT_805361 [Caerostris extrusa]|uniref:Uncharacterized protein n=1 Tax=Caerostris extrusa TaxID=172846 RepID=A0AAV4W381_CAEEX|nr:hypothetical protein CEXT_805361 [Caerostris extrusa]